VITVVVPTRDRFEELRVCLASVLAQDFPPDAYEVVVVDDGSTDGSAEMAASLAPPGGAPALTVVRQGRCGANVARNAGLAVAVGDPVCFIDDDVEAPPGWLAEMAAGFDRHPAAHAFAGRIKLRLEGKPRRSCPNHPVGSSLELGDGDRPIPVGVAANMAVRRSAVDLAGPFDEWIIIGGNDTEWFGRLQRAGGRTVYLGSAWLWHRRTARDLRPWRLARSSFRRGVNSHRFFIRIGRRELGRNARRLVPGLLRHAVRDRCLGALATASLQAGFAWGLWRHRRLQPPP
jgi:glycosyltransferase involved in cell wall biosynthesis